MKFYLGTHQPQWLSQTAIPLFVSHKRLEKRSTFPRALAPWALDSGAFSELSQKGKWTTTPQEYITAVRRYSNEIGLMEWAAPQDSMCEPFIIKKTGSTVLQHQKDTVSNYLQLRALAPELPIIPVLQGFSYDDYFRCWELYETAGVTLADLDIVGLDSICRRQHTQEIFTIAQSLYKNGLSLHGFGVKLKGHALLKSFLKSSDSMAWSFRARYDLPLRNHILRHSNCANCIDYALAWYWQILAELN